MADPADIAQLEIEQTESRLIANLKQQDVEPTDDCIECGNEINEARKKAIKTNLCIGCAELHEIKRKLFRR
ncbi:TraR/DksA family transcriptional regulator [Pseudoalteromonas neustonica]|uniref:TraR/DksA family transcriptional regulator n=1 Tax=Pseudoalteromonas neustonica TaxID=1840331 RepID=A0ABY3F7J2_9GAMM|nr:TraR/DksA C4-type zinc finger protein [Pseudoalteromonas neustonica]TVU79881.1 TraR/DksA family transcriptional regulator [Pseudoalteromonas neustonica]